MELDPPTLDKVKFLFIKELPLGTIFRYKKQFYKRVSRGRAICQDYMGFIDLDSNNQYDGVAVSADCKEIENLEEVKENEDDNWSIWEE
jgi:hypothetical protein